MECDRGKVCPIRRAEQASLQSAGSQLESEIQKLQPKLQIQPELHEECIMQRCRKSTKKENRGIEEKLGTRGETSQRVLEYQPCPSPGTALSLCDMTLIWVPPGPLPSLLPTSAQWSMSFWSPSPGHWLWCHLRLLRQLPAHLRPTPRCARPPPSGDQALLT